MDSLAYENGYLYSVLDDSSKKHLVRISPSALNAAAMNYWNVVRRDIEIRDGLAFRNHVAYGFNEAQNEVRQARQPSPEHLFTLTPHFSHKYMQPRALARMGGKWHVGGHSGDGYIYIFSNTGTYERRVKKPAFSVRGLTSDGTHLIAAANSLYTHPNGFDVRVPHVYKWTPQTDDDTPVSATPFCIPNALGYNPDSVAYDASGTHIWVALYSPDRNILVKLNGTTGAHLGTYRMNKGVSGLTYENGNLYGLSDGDIVMAVASHLKTSPATWVNNWETVKRNSGLRSGLVFRNGTAYGFNQLQDEVRAESGNPTLAPASASPAALPAGSVPPTGADPSAAAASPSGSAATAPNPAASGTATAPDPTTPSS